MPALPTQLPSEPKVLWSIPLADEGLGGIAATKDVVVFGDRDLDDFNDIWRCHSLESGKPLWIVEQLAIDELDYGNSPRATPLIHKGRVFLLGATGELLCVELTTGRRLWSRNLRSEFGLSDELPWGYCGSPLMADGRVIVAAGGPKASIVALSPDGEVLWKTPGLAPGYGSLIVATFGGRRQVVGHDAKTIGGWDVKTGERLWTVTPQETGDFNVPTPIEIDGRLLIVTENNGARLYKFERATGRIVPDPVATNNRLTPNMSSPVVVGNRLFCVDKFLYCLDLADGLREHWRLRDSSLTDYGSIIASDRRMLVTGRGAVLLMATDGSREVISRWQLFEGKVAIYSHPAVVGNRLLIRGPNSLKSILLGE